MFLGNMGVEAMRNFVKVVFADTTNKAVAFHIVFHALELLIKGDNR